MKRLRHFSADASGLRSPGQDRRILRGGNQRVENGIDGRQHPCERRAMRFARSALQERNQARTRRDRSFKPHVCLSACWRNSTIATAYDQHIASCLELMKIPYTGL